MFMHERFSLFMRAVAYSMVKRGRESIMLTDVLEREGRTSMRVNFLANQ